MKTHPLLRARMLLTASSEAVAVLCAGAWWFGYGYYFSHRPGRP